MRKLWKTLLFLVVIAGASAGVYALSRNSKKGNDGPKLVDVTTGSIVEKAVAVGQIQPRQKFQVKSTPVAKPASRSSALAFSGL